MTTKQKTRLNKLRYNDAHRKEISIYNKIYRDSHKEEGIVRGKLWRENNKDKISEYNKEVRISQEPLIDLSKKLGTYFTRWQEDEIDYLLELRSEGKTYKECANMLGRTCRSIENKLRMISKVR